MVTDGNYNYGEHFIMYLTAKSPSYTPETNVLLYINYISINTKRVATTLSMKCATHSDSKG